MSEKAGTGPPRDSAVERKDSEMINETAGMKQARRDLQDLTASDPAVRANMLRHVAALFQMVVSRRGRNSLPGEPHIIATFQFASGEQNICMAVTSQADVEQIMLTLDIDGAAEPPVSPGVIQNIDTFVAAWGVCRLWAPTVRVGRSSFPQANMITITSGSSVVVRCCTSTRSGRQIWRPVFAAVPRDLHGCRTPPICTRSRRRVSCTMSTVTGLAD